jgi:activator of HSP90 ATPase
MFENRNPSVFAISPTRRQMIARAAIAVGGLVTGLGAWGKTRQQTMKETPGTAANQTRTSLHLDFNLKASPQRVYEALLDSKQFAAFSGLPAEIDPKAGGAFSMFGGLIVGRNVELVPNQRIVQAWRPTHWNAGIFSIVKFDFNSQGSETVFSVDHKGFPEGEFDHLTDGWKSHYGEPLKKYFA